jgi:hypothetical protein
MMGERVELAPRSDGARYRRITLDLEADGTVFFRFHETGGSLQAVWGADDKEITVRISADQARRLAFNMIAERLKDQPDPSRALIALCEARGIEFEAAQWT